VTITGTAIPANPLVLVGSSGSATVVRSSSTELVFTAPRLAAGTYDVTVFAQNRVTSDVLADGLVYLAVDGGSGPDQPDQSADPAPGGQPPASGQPDGDEPVGVQREFVGPNGERLVRSDLFASLGRSIWRLNCSVSCAGLAV
jgi:serine protease